MVGYVLGLSNACPVRYGLLFERFTDPDRTEYPDIDIDLCQDGRADVINYVREKYGHVAQIITFGTMKARAAIRDCARVLEVSLPVADRVAKLIPETLGITIDGAIEAEPDFKELCEGQAGAIAKVNKDLPPHQHTGAEQIAQLIDNARVLEGQARHSSVHAAGVIVATRPLHELVPLYRQTGAEEHEIVTQWDGPDLREDGPAEDGLPGPAHAERDRARRRRSSARRPKRRSCTPRSAGRGTTAGPTPSTWTG